MSISGDIYDHSARSGNRKIAAGRGRRGFQEMKWLSVVVAPLLLCSCCKSSTPETPENSKPDISRMDGIAAVVGARKILVGEVERELAQQPEYIRARFVSPERKREFLESMIRSELLVQAARAEGLESDAEVRATLDRLLIQKLLQRRLAPAPPDLEEVRAYSQAHLEEFIRPERVRLSLALFSAPGGDARRGAVKLEAAKGLTGLQALEPGARAAAFAALAHRHASGERTTTHCRFASRCLGLRMVSARQLPAAGATSSRASVQSGRAIQARSRSNAPPRWGCSSAFGTSATRGGRRRSARPRFPTPQTTPSTSRGCSSRNWG